MAPLTKDRRVHPRMSVIWQSMITTADLRIRCRVLNVSDSGAMVQSEERIESQEPIILKIGNGTPQFCEAVWTDSGYLGVRFIGTAESGVSSSSASQLL
jgi:hypothetical protein